jgi:peptide/nickel transport system permease protein
MLILIGRRLLASVFVLLLVTVVMFLGVTSVGDPLTVLRQQPGVSQQTIDSIVARKHLHESVSVQYGYWLRDAVAHRFGTTLFSEQPIWPELRRSLWFTLQLVFTAEAVALVVGVGLGVLSAKRQYSVLDYSTTAVGFLGYSIPIFWFALVLQMIFTNLFRATGVRIFYTAGLSSPQVGPGFAFLVDRIQHLALPVIVLAYAHVARYSRYMRASMLEVAGADYVRTARAKGLEESLITRKHEVRTALIPIVTLAAINFGTVFSGSIVTETVFSIPGMGSFFIDALQQRDVYRIMAFLVVSALFIIGGNLVADIVYGYLDPRIRQRILSDQTDGKRASANHGTASLGLER